MKKVYKQRKYLKWKESFAIKSLRAKNYRKSQNFIYRQGFSSYKKWENYVPIIAPSNFSFLDEPQECMSFFRKVRNKKNHYYKDGFYYVSIDLKNVQNIDYCSVSLLKAILLDFKPQKIHVQGNSPSNPACYNFLKLSGFYDGLLSLTNKQIHEKGNSDRIMFTKGSGSLSDAEDMELTRTLKKVRKYLTGEDGHCPQLRTIILEICGNSIEHSESFNKQWMFGVRYEHDRVLISLIDTGRGILNTLYRKLGRRFYDFVSKSNKDVLEGAFDKKYESKTKDINRNKGLPVIKLRFTEGFIKGLVVITNNVVLNFANQDKSFHLPNRPGFDGTIFMIELDRSCFNCSNKKNEI